MFFFQKAYMILNQLVNRTFDYSSPRVSPNSLRTDINFILEGKYEIDPTKVNWDVFSIIELEQLMLEKIVLTLQGSCPAYKDPL